MGCDNASGTVGIGVSSDNNTLVHFPSEVDMFDLHLQNAIAVIVGWIWVNETAYIASLDYTFDNVSLEEARANADAITPSMSAAFGVSFICSTNHTTNGDAAVGYQATGYSDVTNLVEWLVSLCVAGDVNGFSDDLPGFVAKMSVPWVSVSASKEAGSFNWDTSIGSFSEFSIPPSSNSHTIDVLDLLGVSSLAPSPYGLDGNSTIWLSIWSSTSISFVSCEPPLVPGSPFDPPPGEKGWTVLTTPPSPYFDVWALTARFSFGGDPSPVTQLSLTFSGTIISEFTSLTLILTLMLAVASVFSLKKRLLQIK